MGRHSFGKTKDSKNKKIMLISGAVALVLVITIAIVCIVKGCSAKKSATTNDTEIGSDLLDPENQELNHEQGASVDAQDLYHEQGKANGVDVSKWQGKVDWSAVKESGVDFAIIRIGYRAENGKIYKDEYADYNIQQAQKSGLLIGVYFFSTATNETEAKEEADWTVSQIEGYPISYPVVYDCEGFLNQDSRMNGVSNGQRTQNAMAFLKAITNEGYEGMLYAAKSELEGSAYWDTPTIESAFKIWVARYPSTPYPDTKTPDYSGKYDMWQYTNMGKVNGISGNTDLIVSYFTRSEAKPKNTSAKTSEASAPKSDNTYTSVNESVTAKEITNLRDAASTKSNIVATLKNGDFITRIGVGTNGWSELTYNGQTVYAISSYLTTDQNYVAPNTTPSSAPETPTEKPAQNDGFTSVNEQVTAKDTTNLRSGPSTSDSIVATIKNGDMVTRIGTNPNGWSKLEYNGQTVYAVSSFLTTEVNQKPSSSETSTAEKPSDGYKAVNESVTAKSETNLRSAPSTGDGSTVVYCLKNGERVTRVGINDNGWSKLEYNGQTVYAISSYLTTD